MPRSKMTAFASVWKKDQRHVRKREEQFQAQDSYKEILNYSHKFIN